MKPIPCPCGNPDYERCCGRFIRGEHAGTAEQLMRSRYSAYVLEKPGYLHATWHPGTRPTLESLQADMSATRWLGLTVKRHDITSDNNATVEFVARYKPAGSGKAERLHETSRFVREKDQWFYVDGDFV